MSLSMTKDEREAFLTDLHVAVISITDEGRGPLAVPVWYSYKPGGEVHVTTEGSSRKARLLRQAGRFTLCVQQETHPYKYVSVEGPVVAIEPVDIERDMTPLVNRYLNPEDATEYLEGLDSAAGIVLVRMQPERWYSEDYAKYGTEGN